VISIPLRPHPSDSAPSSPNAKFIYRHLN
jgi:hypothetical protein